ncbi:uncharacterized protein LOC144479966 isoform X2 [Mustelus asterias]
MEMENQQKLTPVDLKDDILWLKSEEITDGFEKDCLDFSDKKPVFLQDHLHKLLVFTNNKTAEFRDLNEKQKAEGIRFEIINYETVECTKNCNFRKFSFPVSFVVQHNSKTYQMSCTKPPRIEFLELNTPEKETIDVRKRNILFYMKTVKQFSVFESDFARGHYLCTKFENGLYKLALKNVTTSIDEETHLKLCS